jgi:hypothetical protein
VVRNRNGGKKKFNYQGYTKGYQGYTKVYPFKRIHPGIFYGMRYSEIGETWQYK